MNLVETDALADRGNRDSCYPIEVSPSNSRLTPAADGRFFGHRPGGQRLSRRFGPFAEDAYTEGVPGFPEVQPLIKEADERTGVLFGSGWHTDSAFLPEPPAISLLRSIEIPPFGGDTIWANSALAYRALSPTMQGLLQGLRVHMSMGKCSSPRAPMRRPSTIPSGS